MARRELTVTHYEAEMVLHPLNGATAEVVRITVFGPNLQEAPCLRTLAQRPRER